MTVPRGLVLVCLVVAGALALTTTVSDDSSVTAGSNGADGSASPQAAQSAGPEFDQDLAISKAITKVAVGDPCENADPSWLIDETADQPPLAPVEGPGPDGGCVIAGWSYLDATKPLPFERPEAANGYVRQPIFGEDGKVIKYFSAGPPSSEGK